MKIPKSFAAVLSIIIFLIGACSQGPEFNRGKFAQVKAAAEAVKTAIKAGESYQQVTAKGQQLKTEMEVLER